MPKLVTRTIWNRAACKPQRTLVVTLLMALLAVSQHTFGQQSSSRGSSGTVGNSGETVGTASLSGGVYDAVSGSPLGKAELRLMTAMGIPGAVRPAGGPHVSTARTNASGSFHLEGIPAGDYFLTVTRRAYSNCGAEVTGVATRQQGCAAMISIRDGVAIKEVQVRLQPAAVVTGQVTDEDGEPMAGVMVSAQQYRYMRGTRQLSPTSNATTDDRGTYRLYNLAPGRYFVMAQSRNAFPQARGGMMPGGMGRTSAFARGAAGQANESATYTATYYPAGDTPAEAIPLQLTPGAEMGGIDIRLTPKQTYSLEGMVTGIENGDGNAMLIVRRADGASQLGAFSTSAMVNPRTGTFVARGLTPGRYEVIARSGSARRGQGNVFGASGRTIVDVGNSSLEGVTIALRPDAMLPGRVVVPRDSGEVALTGIRVMAERGMGGGMNAMRVDADGSFQVPVSAADSFGVSIENLPEGFYVKAMNLGGTNLLEAGAQAPAEPSGSFEIQLANDGGSVSGVARNSSGVAVSSARVVLMAEREGAARKIWSRTLLSDDDGAFSVSALAPGRYRAYLFEDLMEGAALDPEFLSQFGQRAKSLEVKAKGNTTLEASLIPASDTAMLLGEIAQ